MQNTYWCNNKDERRLLKKKYTSHFISKVCVWEGVGDWIKTATYWHPQPLWTSPCVVLVLLGCSTGGLGAQPLWDMFSFQHLLTNWSGLQNSLGSRGPLLLGGGFPYHILSLTNWLPVFTELYNSSIAHSISLEWHVWSSSSGNNCHAVHRSLSSGASVYECTTGFYLVPFFSAKPANAISSHNCHWNVSLPSGASLWNGMFGRVEGQYTTQLPEFISTISSP